MNIRDIWTHLVYWYGNCLGGIASAWEWRTNWGFTGGHGSDVGKREWNNTCNTYIYTQKGHQKDVVKCPWFHFFISETTSFRRQTSTLLFHYRNVGVAALGLKCPYCWQKQNLAAWRTSYRQHLHLHSSKQKENILWSTKFKQLTQLFMKV